MQGVPEAVEQYIGKIDILPAIRGIGKGTNRQVHCQALRRYTVLNKKIFTLLYSRTRRSYRIDPLNVTIQKLTQLRQTPTDASKLAKLKGALEIPLLNHLRQTISLKADPTPAEIVTTCKRYDKAVEIGYMLSFVFTYFQCGL